MAKPRAKQSDVSKSGRRKITLEEKQAIIRDMDREKSYDKVAAKRGLSKSTVSTIYKKRNEIIRSCIVEGMHNRNRIRKSKFEELEDNLYAWFKSVRTDKVTVNGPMLRAKAKEMAEQLGCSDEFKASVGWLDRFRNRHSIVYSTVSGESAGVDQTVVDNHQDRILKDLEGFSLCNVYNMDELALFYK
jgi:hypothetical protein